MGWLSMRFARVLPLALVLLSARALAADPFPPQLAISFVAVPAPIVQDGSTRLVYEMQIINYTQPPYVLDAVEVKAGETAATFRGAALEGMIRRFGYQGEPAGAANRTIEPGRGARDFKCHPLDADVVEMLNPARPELGDQVNDAPIPISWPPADPGVQAAAATVDLYVESHPGIPIDGAVNPESARLGVCAGDTGAGRFRVA